MRRRPPWKAESARIRAEITARKKQAIRLDAKAITFLQKYPITLEASAFENPLDGLYTEYLEGFYRRKLTDMILATIRNEELISVRQIERSDGIKQWRATLRVVI